MLFNSYVFLLAFLPIVFLIYFSFRYLNLNKMAKFVLLISSLFFYGYFKYEYLIIIISSIIINFTLSQFMQRYKEKSIKRKVVLTIGLIFNIGLIFYFKYFDFFISNINQVFDSAYNLKYIALPLGISFFTFQQISFIVDAYYGSTKDYSFIDYSLFVSFFPQLIAGPIVLHDELIPQINNKNNFKLDFDNIAKGLYILSIGLFKKVIIADTFGGAVSWGFNNIATLSSLDGLIVMLAYTIQIYFDFSGYSDMAIGIAKLFNFDLPQNFNSPYKAKSIIEFWKRWHMTLTRFLTTYVYIPLGGSRKGEVRTYVNIFIVFLVSGLWHGANWNFLLWGFLHGLFNVLTRLFQKSWNKMHEVYQWALTFIFINFTWVFFRADSINQAVSFIKNIVSNHSTTLSAELVNHFVLPEIFFISQLSYIDYLFNSINGLAMIIFIISVITVILNFKNTSEIKFKSNLARAIITIFFLLWSTLSFSGVSTFLYFNF